MPTKGFLKSNLPARALNRIINTVGINTLRIVLRPSGTEKKIRIMAECEEENLLNKTIKILKSRITTLINEYEKN